MRLPYRASHWQPVVLSLCVSLGLVATASAQSAPTLADLRWSTAETRTGRFVIVPGERAFIGGYRDPGLEVWTYPLQVVRDYWISFRTEGDTTEIDGRTVLRSIEHTPTAATRVYVTPGFTVRERIFTPMDLPAATIRYDVESARSVRITVHFTPSLNLMWPGAVGGQELHWDGAHSAYTLDEPSRRFRGAIVATQAIDHEQRPNNTRNAEFERGITLTLRATPGAPLATISFAGSSAPNETPVAIAEVLTSRLNDYEARARERYAALHVIDVETPDSTVNRALRWAQVTLEQAWACNPQLGCGLLAGYGPSRGARRPQYAWFFANDGLVAVDALLREGAYARARDELTFIMRYQNKRTGAIWHELSQSAGFLDWERAYPYMFVHVDISFDFLSTMRDYVETTGDVAFATTHWDAIRRAYEYCRATIPPNGVLPEIPAGQQGRDEQDPQRDELSLSLAWPDAAASFATLARLTRHDALAMEATRANARARAAIRPKYYDPERRTWASGHLRSGAPVEGLTGSLTALLHHGLLNEPEQHALLDRLASPNYRAPWGVRSTPNDSPLYDPDSYARGSVWALGTADAISAFYEAGRAANATALWRDLVPWFEIDSPGHVPEVLRGDAFSLERESVPDQSWSSAAFVSSGIRGMLGLTSSGLRRQLRFAPSMPAEWDSLRVRQVNVAGSDIGLALGRVADHIELAIDNSGPEMTLTFRAPLRSGELVRAVEASKGARIVPRTNGAPADEITVVCPAHSTTHLAIVSR